MTTKKSGRSFERFKESLTVEQRTLLDQSCDEAERGRPEMRAKLRRYEKNMAPVNAELRNAFQLLMAWQKQEKVSRAELANRADIDKDRLAALEADHAAVLTIDMLSAIATALGAELRISVGRKPANHSRRSARRKAVTA